MRHPISHPQAQALTRLLLTIRPDWSKSYVEDAVSRMRSISDDLEDIVRVAVRGALSPAIAKPDVLAMTGDHWKARTEPDAPPPAAPVVFRCRCGDVHNPGSPCRNQPTSTRPGEHLAAARAAIRAAKEPADA